MGADFRIGATKSGRCTLHTSGRIVARAFQLYTVDKMMHSFKYTSGIITDMKWVVVERAEVLLFGTACAPFFLRKLVQVNTCTFSSRMKHEMGADRVRQNKTSSYSSVSFQRNAEARSLLYILLFHSLNSLGTLRVNILEMDKRNWYEEASTANWRRRTNPQCISAKIE